MGKNGRAGETGMGKNAVDDITRERKQWPRASVVSGAQGLTPKRS